MSLEVGRSASTVTAAIADGLASPRSARSGSSANSMSRLADSCSFQRSMTAFASARAAASATCRLALMAMSRPRPARRRRQRRRRAGVLLQAVDVIRLGDPDVLGFEIAHDVGNLPAIIDAEVEQGSAGEVQILRTDGDEAEPARRRVDGLQRHVGGDVEHHFVGHEPRLSARRDPGEAGLAGKRPMRKPVAGEAARQPAVAKTAVCRQSARLGDGIAAIERCCAALVLIRTARVSVLLILTVLRRGSLAARTVLEWTVLKRMLRLGCMVERVLPRLSPVAGRRAGVAPEIRRGGPRPGQPCRSGTCGSRRDATLERRAAPGCAQTKQRGRRQQTKPSCRPLGKTDSTDVP